MNPLLKLLSMRSTWFLIAALANAAGLYVNPQMTTAVAEFASAAAKGMADQEQCKAPWVNHP